MSNDSNEGIDIGFSQNFLRNRSLVERLVERSTITPGDLVVEIGPGKGIITAELARRSGRVVAVEKDPRLAGELRRRFASEPNVEIYLGDALKFPLPQEPYKVFSNIPFNIAADLVRKLVEAEPPPEDSYLVVQAAAAVRFAGAPYGKDTQFSVLIKPFFELSVVHTFRRTDFSPTPKVDIVLLRIRKREWALVAPRDAALYRDFVVYTFNRWKPSVQEAVMDLIPPPRFLRIAQELRFNPLAKPTELAVEHWVVLFDRFLEIAGERGRRAVAGAERRLRKQQAGLQKIHRTRQAPDWTKHGRGRRGRTR